MSEKMGPPENLEGGLYGCTPLTTDASSQLLLLAHGSHNILL